MWHVVLLGLAAGAAVLWWLYRRSNRSAAALGAELKTEREKLDNSINPKE